MGGIYNCLPLSIKNYKSHDFSLVSKFLLNSTQTMETDRCLNLLRSSVRLIEIGNSITICPLFVQRKKREVLHQVYLHLLLRLDERETRDWSFPKPQHWLLAD